MRWVIGFVGLMLAMGGAAPSAAQPGPATVAQGLERLTERMRASGFLEIAGERVRVSDVTLLAYERRAFEPIWSEASGLEALLRSVRAVDTDGLDPEL